MLQQTPTRNPIARPVPTLAPKVCVCCGRKLKANIAHTETPLGPIGPECERKADVTSALDRLHAHGLSELVDGLRLNGNPGSAGAFRFPEAAFEQLKVRAAAAGVRLRWSVDHPARQFIVTIHEDSIPGLLKVQELQLTNPMTGAVSVPYRIGGQA